MQPSSTFCRAQETRQHALAADTPLANARHVATRAAAAWGKEADAAERREQRIARRTLEGDSAPAPHPDHVEPQDDPSGEHPGARPVVWIGA